MVQSYNGDADYGGRDDGGEIVCPVCLVTVFGDPDVTAAHVDACLVHAIPSAQEQTAIDIGGPSRARVTDSVDLTGLPPPKKKLSNFSDVQVNVSASGFHVRDMNHKDVEDEIDVDGNDEDIFGCVQFTEVDILSASRPMSSSGVSEATVEIEGASIPLEKHQSPDSQSVRSPTIFSTRRTRTHNV